jgi:hypothetical protein
MSGSKKFSWVDAKGGRNTVLVHGSGGGVREIRRAGKTFSPHADLACYEGPPRWPLREARWWASEAMWRESLPPGTVVEEEVVAAKKPVVAPPPPPAPPKPKPTFEERVRALGGLPRLVLQKDPKEVAFAALLAAGAAAGGKADAAEVVAARKAYDAAVPLTSRKFDVVKGDANSVWVETSYPAKMFPVFLHEAEGQFLVRVEDWYYPLTELAKFGVPEAARIVLWKMDTKTGTLVRHGFP